jgi:hypothetical protein
VDQLILPLFNFFETRKIIFVSPFQHFDQAVHFARVLQISNGNSKPVVEKQRC